MDTTTAADLIRELEEQAVEHKKLERRNRALAQRSYAAAQQLRAFCEASGIPVVTSTARKERAS